ncbi:hypothetical protein AAY473_027357 [Plecturocebus cupreus]
MALQTLQQLGLTLLPRQECSGVIMVHCSLDLLGLRLKCSSMIVGRWSLDSEAQAILLPQPPEKRGPQKHATIIYQQVLEGGGRWGGGAEVKAPGNSCYPQCLTTQQRGQRPGLPMLKLKPVIVPSTDLAE